MLCLQRRLITLRHSVTSFLDNPFGEHYASLIQQTGPHIYGWIFHSCSKISNSIFAATVIIIMSCRPHWYPWPSFATIPYRSLPPADLLDYIPFLHIAAVCMFELVVLLLLGHKWGSIGVHHLWTRLCSSCSVLRAWFV